MTELAALDPRDRRRRRAPVRARRLVPHHAASRRSLSSRCSDEAPRSSSCSPPARRDARAEADGRAAAARPSPPIAAHRRADEKGTRRDADVPRATRSASTRTTSSTCPPATTASRRSAGRSSTTCTASAATRRNWIKGGQLDEAADALGLASDRRDARRRRRLLHRQHRADRLRRVHEGRHRPVHAGVRSRKHSTCVRKRNYETYIVKDLIGEIDAKYRTIATREGRAIAGLSMGGFGALELVDAPSQICSPRPRATPASTRCSTRARIRT